MPVSTAEFLAGMRRLAAGVTIVTARHGGVPAGMTATAVCSLTAEPPSLLACIQRGTDTHDAIAGSGGFAVNLLTTRHRRLSDLFGGREGSFGPARFARGRWADGSTGAPLLRDAAAVFECRLRESLAASTHTVFIGEVVAVTLGEGEPLVYRDRAYHRLSPLVGA